MMKGRESVLGGSSLLRRRRVNKAERRQAERIKSRFGEAPGLLPLLAGGLAIKAFPAALGGSALQGALLALGALAAGGATLGDAAPTMRPRIAQDEAAAKPEDVGPRARALLRGRDMAARDLAEAGGGYSLDEVRRLLNSVSRQSVEKRVREGRLLAVAGPNNRRLYPAVQFRDDGYVVEGLAEVQEALATRNGYAVLNFLVNPDPRLDGVKPIDLLRRGEVARVVEAAARFGEQGG